MAERILISGASGFVASHIVAGLLDAGYEVVGTVRNPDDAAKTAFLREMPGAAERLQLVAADLNDDDPFSSHTDDVDHVIHTASPYVLDVDDAKRDLVDPAVNGTLSMLRACAGRERIGRVVLTSSMAAITDEPDETRILTEADWNETSSLTRNPYYHSKTKAERAAWDFVAAEMPPWDLVAINPFMVIGPAMTQALNTSNQVIADLLNGKYPAVMNLTMGYVDVRDVADAHIRALSAKGAEGRYICAHETRSLRGLIGTLKKSDAVAKTKLPTLSLDTALGTRIAKAAAYFQPAGVRSYLQTHLGRTPRFDNSKIKRDLGLSFRDLDQTILDTAADLARWGHVKSA